MEKFDLDGQEIEINDEFKGTLNLLENSGKCIFVTGKAGTGKSTLLKYFVKKTKKKIVLLAPTGVAALNVGGVTIHSFFKFPPRPITDADIRQYSDEIYKQIEIILIDEVSMVRADMLDAIDKFLRKNGKSPHKPFGGIQMVFFGDLYQLEPIVKGEEEQKLFASYYESPWFFDSKVLKEIDVQLVELKNVYRQKDSNFIDLLDSFRKNRFSNVQLENINNLCDRTLDLDTVESSIVLTCTNRRAKYINNKKLAQLTSQEFTFLGTIEGRFPEENLPTEIELKLKKGAKVMFIKNDYRKRWVNGTIGYVHSLDESSIKVEVNNDIHQFVYDVDLTSWEILKYKYNPISRSIETEVVGLYRQFPLKLAWAVTIHKSQGLTFNELIIDLENRAFAHGQTYVALSRCTTYDGIILKRPIRRDDIIVDISVNRYFDSYNYDSQAKLFETDTLDSKIIYETKPKELVRGENFSETTYSKKQESIRKPLHKEETLIQKYSMYWPVPVGLSVVGFVGLFVILIVIVSLVLFSNNQVSSDSSKVNITKLTNTIPPPEKTKTKKEKLTENDTSKQVTSIPAALMPIMNSTSTPSCLNWNSINGIHRGKELCVYGTIVKVGGTIKYPIIIRFSEEPGAFMIRGPYRGFVATKGQCIKAEGVVMKDITYLYMDTEEIELSDYGGCK
jgi:energy-coupling factor transporter ATP-binding protein EcfA2